MTREEEMEKEAFRVSHNWDEFSSFIQGGEWADNHPRRVYIVMRCGEHSDYVEKVFVDNDKAVAYCNKFNSSTSNEYFRIIEEMEVTL